MFKMHIAPTRKQFDKTWKLGAICAINKINHELYEIINQVYISPRIWRNIVNKKMIKQRKIDRNIVLIDNFT